MILRILNDCVGFSDVSGTSTTRRDRPWLRMNWRSQEEASLKLRRPRKQASKYFFWCESSITESLEIAERNDSAAYGAPEATASSVSQSGTEESNSLLFQSNSLTHTTILSHTHYNILSHTQVYALSHTTVLSHILLYSHIRNYTRSYIHVNRL